MNSPSATIVAVVLFCCGLSAQDATWQHYRGNESSFNPALTGQVGATRLTVSSRSQWSSNTVTAANFEGYTSRGITYEEGLPCLFFDYGLYLRRDAEGEGRLTNTEAGGRVAVAIPLIEQANDRALNLRIGLGLGRGQRTIDYSRLTFLDQIDPMSGFVDGGGNPNVSSFMPPSALGSSPWYTASALGVSLKGGMRNRGARHGDRPLLFDVGLAVHNWGGLVSRDGRQSASVAGLDAVLEERWVGSATAEVVIARKNGRYWSLNPLVVLQKQDRFAYAEFGTGLSWNRNLELGYYHHLSGDAGAGASWSSLRVTAGTVFPDGYTRLDVAMGWSFQYGNLKNYVRAPFELTATFSFGRSISCLSSGGESDFVRGTQGSLGCYSFGTARGRIYDNIWNDR